MREKIAKRLKKFRKSCQLSQEELAEAIGVSRSMVSSWELGRTDITVKDALKVVEYLNISLDELVY